MKYTVIWRPAAEGRLSDLWTAGPDRQAIAEAANRIDSALKAGPRQQGESRDDKRRVFFVQPLAVLYSIDEGDCMVYVLDVWPIK